MVSPTNGRVSMDDIASIIRQKVLDGHGIFFYEVSRVRRIENVKEKLFFETTLSLQCAGQLMEAFERLKEATGFDYENVLNFSIHVDTGYNGPSCQVIPEVVGWIRACGYNAVVKPESYAACSIANKYSK